MPKGHYAQLKTTLCCRCHREPRRTTHSYCLKCLRAYNREWCARRRGSTPRPIKPVLPPGEKFCPKCDRTLPIERFSRCSSKRDGRISNCKDCDYLKQLRYKEKNRAKVRDYNRTYQREYRAANPDHNRMKVAEAKRRRIAKKMQQAANGARP